MECQITGEKGSAAAAAANDTDDLRYSPREYSALPLSLRTSAMLPYSASISSHRRVASLYMPSLMRDSMTVMKFSGLRSALMALR